MSHTQTIEAIPLHEDIAFGNQGEDDPLVQFNQYYADYANDEQAQIFIGDLYYFGLRGMARNYGRAVHYYRLAAELGNAYAMGRLGDVYIKGEGVEANNKTALQYIQQAIKKVKVTWC